MRSSIEIIGDVIKRTIYLLLLTNNSCVATLVVFYVHNVECIISDRQKRLSVKIMYCGGN